ncbi:MAG: hypothetical protein WC676_05155 [Candidatus Omnitrophota bacterium]
MAGHENDLESLAITLSKSVASILREKAELKLSKEPEVKKKYIIEYNGRMRADGMEKFNDPTFVSVVNYFATAKDMEKKNILGALIVYVQQEYIATLLRLLKYPPVDDENENAMLDACGTLCNIVAGRFKSEISTLGFIELEMSPFSNYKNSASNGVGFCYKEYDKYELTFYLENKKRLVVEMTMGPIPKRK